VIRPIFGFAVKNKEGITIYNTNSEWQEVANLDEAKAGSETVVNFSFPNLLYEGDYFISLGVASSDTNGEIIPHDRRYDSIHISVAPVKKFTGFTDLSAKIEIVHE